MNTNNPFVKLANDAIEGGLWSGLGNVRVMNLSLNGVEAQDQLMLVARTRNHGSARARISSVVWQRRVARKPGAAAKPAPSIVAIIARCGVSAPLARRDRRTFLEQDPPRTARLAGRHHPRHTRCCCDSARLSEGGHRLARRCAQPRSARPGARCRPADIDQHEQPRIAAGGCGRDAARGYDVVLDLQGLLKSAVLARLSGARRVVGFPRGPPARTGRALFL